MTRIGTKGIELRYSIASDRKRKQYHTLSKNCEIRGGIIIIINELLEQYIPCDLKERLNSMNQSIEAITSQRYMYYYTSYIENIVVLLDEKR